MFYSDKDMDTEIVCVTNQESPGLIDCHYDVDPVAKPTTTGVAPIHDLFASNSAGPPPLPYTMDTADKSQGNTEECSSGLEMEDIDQSPSPDEFLHKYDSGITLILENAELWSKFRDVHTEMIITKSGRYSVT